MATGTLNNVTAPGTITVVTDFTGQLNPGDSINFDALVSGANINDDVNFEIDSTGREPLAINITIIAPPDDNYPYNNEFPGATIINTPQTGNLAINATTTIIDGTTLTGNITVTNGGTLVIKTVSPQSTIQSIVTGNITATDNATVIIYDSIIEKNVITDNAAELRVIKKTHIKGNIEVAKTAQVTIKGGVKGNIEVARSGKVKVRGGGLKGNIELISNRNIDIKDATIEGNLKISLTGKETVVTNVTSTKGNITINGNAGCSYTNVTAPAGKVTINDCIPA